MLAAPRPALRASVLSTSAVGASEADLEHLTPETHEGHTEPLRETTLHTIHGDLRRVFGSPACRVARLASPFPPSTPAYEAQGQGWPKAIA